MNSCMKLFKILGQWLRRRCSFKKSFTHDGHRTKKGSQKLLIGPMAQESK